MLAYTIQSTYWRRQRPSLTVGAGGDATLPGIPANPQEDTYWICIIDAKNPRVMVKDFIVKGSNNSTVPPGIDTYMNDPDYLFVVATQTLSTLHVPQGAFFDFLVKYGAGRELQKLEQLNVVLGCGTCGRVSYILTGHCGPRGSGKPTPASYELGDHVTGTILMMSLMPQANGAPPYGRSATATPSHLH